MKLESRYIFIRRENIYYRILSPLPVTHDKDRSIPWYHHFYHYQNSKICSNAKNCFQQLYPIYVRGRINILYDLPPIDEEESIDTSGYRLLYWISLLQWLYYLFLTNKTSRLCKSSTTYIYVYLLFAYNPVCGRYSITFFVPTLYNTYTESILYIYIHIYV